MLPWRSRGPALPVWLAFAAAGAASGPRGLPGGSHVCPTGSVADAWALPAPGVSFIVSGVRASVVSQAAAASAPLRKGDLEPPPLEADGLGRAVVGVLEIDVQFGL